jgi:hypothetical protein
MAGSGVSVSQIGRPTSSSLGFGGNEMAIHELSIAGAVISALAIGVAFSQYGSTPPATEHGPYARIAFLKPRDVNTVDFEAGYVRHLEWHRQASDPFVWYGWTIWAGERQRWLVYATFGHSAAAFDAAVKPAEDEKDNVANVVPHSEFAGSGLYEYLPALSRGTGVPTADARVELTTVELLAGAGVAFETAVAAHQPKLSGETLWYRMVAGGPTPRYVRLRPCPSLVSLLGGASERRLPDEVSKLVAKETVEILNLRPNMSYGLPETK